MNGLLRGLMDSVEDLTPNSAAPAKMVVSASRPSDLSPSTARGEVLDGPGAPGADVYYGHCEHGQTAGTCGRCLNKTKNFTPIAKLAPGTVLKPPIVDGGTFDSAPQAVDPVVEIAQRVSVNKRRAEDLRTQIAEAQRQLESAEAQEATARAEMAEHLAKDS